MCLLVGTSGSRGRPRRIQQLQLRPECERRDCSSRRQRARLHDRCPCCACPRLSRSVSGIESALLSLFGAICTPFAIDPRPSSPSGLPARRRRRALPHSMSATFRTSQTGCNRACSAQNALPASTATIASGSNHSWPSTRWWTSSCNDSTSAVCWRTPTFFFSPTTATSWENTDNLTARTRHTTRRAGSR